MTIRTARTVLVALLVAAGLAGCAAQDRDASKIIGESLHQSARASEQSGDYTTAANQYRSILDRAPNDLDALLGLARNLRYSGSARYAVNALETARERLDKNAEYRMELGKAKLAVSEAEAAIGHLKAAIELGGNDWRAYAAIGIADDLLQKYDDARTAYMKALELSKDNPAVLNNMAISAALSGDIQRAIAIIENAPADVRRTPQIRQNLALFYGIKGDLKKAESLARKDLDEKAVRRNMAIYSRLRASRGTAITR